MSIKTALDESTFEKLKKLYLIALFTIAVTVVMSQVLIQVNLKSQLSDSKIINISGRQRMLSQKLVKELLVLNNLKTKNSRLNQIQKINQTLTIWESSHQSLMHGNDTLFFPKTQSPKIAQLYTEINPVFNKIFKAAKALTLQECIPNNENKNRNLLDKIEIQEVIFLNKMNMIVSEYDYEAKEKVKQQSKIDYFILIFTLLILLLEFIFIFRPTANHVKNLIAKLLESEKAALNTALNTEILSEIKENSVNELKSLNYALDNTLLYSRVSTNGNLIHIGEQFSKLIKSTAFVENRRFSEVITSIEKEQLIIEKLITQYHKKGWQGEIGITTAQDKQIWLDMSMVPVIIKKDTSELLIICFDITERKLAEQEVERLNKENVKEKINQQKIISSKIVENQENEQNRIAREIHDGIGQMLTGLKLSLESINLDDKNKASQKVDYLKNLSLDIIKAVRTATFNLMPPELSDHGIVSSISKLTQVLHKLTGKEILLYNKTDFNNRLDSHIEINLYRVVQEAINNAIKYSEATHIIIQISHSSDILSIIIDDNGNGFDMEQVKKRKNKESGMGLQFMKQRIQYINGRIFINSVLHEGTRITINVGM